MANDSQKIRTKDIPMEINHIYKMHSQQANDNNGNKSGENYRWHRIRGKKREKNHILTITSDAYCVKSEINPTKKNILCMCVCISEADPSESTNMSIARELVCVYVSDTATATQQKRNEINKHVK